MNLKDISIAIFGCKDTTVSLLSVFTEADLITISPECAMINSVAGYKEILPFKYRANTYSLKNDIEYFKNKKYDIGFCLGWQRLVPEEALNTFSFGVYGMHGSAFDLPIGRVRSPMNWALIEGRKSFYTNLFKYKPGIDDGDIVDKYKFEITDTDTAKTMHIKNTMAMVFLVKKNILKIINGEISPTPQKNISPTFYPKRTYEYNLIDWTKSVHDIHRHIRAVSEPFGSAYGFIGEKKIIIKKAQVVNDEFDFYNSTVGEVVSVVCDCPIVKCFGGLLLIEEFEGDMSVGNVFNNEKVKNKFSINYRGGYDEGC